MVKRVRGEKEHGENRLEIIAGNIWSKVGIEKKEQIISISNE